MTKSYSQMNDAEKRNYHNEKKRESRQRQTEKINDIRKSYR